jgi:CheY-like chemotaxis protein
MGIAKKEKRILAVDDDDAIRTLLLTILRRRGFVVDTARNGVEALEQLERCSYVLMLLDLMMPVMSGWQVLEHLATQEPAKRPAIILLTAGTEPRDVSPDLVIGSIRKPFDVELLIDTVTGCIAAVSERSQFPDCPLAESDPKFIDPRSR